MVPQKISVSSWLTDGLIHWTPQMLYN